VFVLSLKKRTKLDEYWLCTQKKCSRMG